MQLICDFTGLSSNANDGEYRKITPHNTIIRHSFTMLNKRKHYETEVQNYEEN